MGHGMRVMNQGFTLLEVLLTIALIGVGFFALMQILTIGLSSSGINENELVAANFCQERLEAFRNMNYSAIVNETKALVLDFPAYQREVIVTEPQTKLKEIKVKTYWYSKLDELNITLTTLVANISS